MAIEERCEFLPFCSPRQVFVKNGKITSVEFVKTEQTESGASDIEGFESIDRRVLGDWIEDEDQIIRLKCNYIISAFGSTLNELSGSLFGHFDRSNSIFLFLQLSKHLNLSYWINTIILLLI